MLPLLLLMYFSHFDIIIYVDWFPSSFADIVFVINFLFRMWWFSLSSLTTPCLAANIITRYINWCLDNMDSFSHSYLYLIWGKFHFCLCFIERIEWMKTFPLDWTIWPPERRHQLAHCTLSGVVNANDEGCYLQHCSSQNVSEKLKSWSLQNPA